MQQVEVTNGSTYLTRNNSTGLKNFTFSFWIKKDLKYNNNDQVIFESNNDAKTE